MASGAPEFAYDDFAGIDVNGRIVVYLDGAPPRFPPPDRAYYAGRPKFQQAAAHGAVGMVDLWVGESANGYAFSLLAQDLEYPDFRWFDPRGNLSDAYPEIRGNLFASEAAAPKLLQFSGKTLAAVLSSARSSRSQAFPLDLEIVIETSSAQSKAFSPNVAAVLRGADPKLRDEYVVYSAHLDHLGLGPAVNGDRIYNGARDNASGVAALIEIARAFRLLSPPPRRSILFLALTGEELGLFGLTGSDYFVHHPTVPRGGLVADINIDGLPMLYDFRDVIAYGAEDSSLGATARQAAKRMGLTLSPDPWPEQQFFTHGDQYSFALAGIPAIYVQSGFQAATPGVNGKDVWAKWRSERYHKPSDDMAQPLDFLAAVKGTRLQFLIGALLANDMHKPEWTGGDFYGSRFGLRR